ncbi:MAG: DDE-type integrase/transposase/recombinase, partial [Nitrospiraceae bacterium]
LTFAGMGCRFFPSQAYPTDFAHCPGGMTFDWMNSPLFIAECPMKEIHPVALFRLSVLGPLISRDRLEIGELQRVLIELSQKDYAIPGTDRCRVGVKTLEAWYYRWRREGIEGLTPKSRADQGLSKLSEEVQDLILKAKRENPRRSLNQIRHLLESTGKVPRGVISQSALHRFLKQQGLSRMQGASPLPEEHRSFVAQEANGIWYGDVMHGPRVRIKNQIHKGYLVSLMDDASRLITHSAFCPGETALDVEGVLKQAVLKRGLPRKLVVDQGAAYRSKTLQGICARLSIHLVYCRPYAPEGKGKIERWHRTLREQFLREIDPREVLAIEDLNARLWIWLAQVYHVRPHGGL